MSTRRFVVGVICGIMLSNRFAAAVAAPPVAVPALKSAAAPAGEADRFSFLADTNPPYCRLNDPLEDTNFDAARSYQILHSDFSAGWTPWSYLAIRTPKGWYRYLLGRGDAVDNSHCNGSYAAGVNGLEVTRLQITTRFVVDSQNNPHDGVPGSRSQSVDNFTFILTPDRVPICVQSSTSRELPYKG